MKLKSIFLWGFAIFLVVSVDQNPLNVASWVRGLFMLGAGFVQGLSTMVGAITR